MFLVYFGWLQKFEKTLTKIYTVKTRGFRII